MKNIRILYYIIAGLIIFYIDTLIPLGFGVWIIYIFTSYLYIRNAPIRHIPPIVLFYILLMAAGYFYSPPAIFAIELVPVINRIGAALLLILFAAIGINEKKSKEDKIEILERINDLFFMVDKNFQLTFLNNSAKGFNGFNQNALGKNYFDVLSSTRNSVFEENIRKSLEEQKNVRFEGEIPAEGVLDVSLYPSKEGVSIFARNITDRVIAERKLRKLLSEKETLLREIHHRTKNNLQLILSLLNLQISRLDNETVIQILQETRARLLSLSLLHEKLQMHGDIYSVEVKPLIEDIVVKMDNAANFGLIKINHVLDIDEIKLQMDLAIPIGLIINELYTNSLKYAFKGKDKCFVHIKLKKTGNDLVLVYKDNGKGFPEDFNIYESSGLGSSIILAFVEQLNGKIIYHNNDGAEYNITFREASSHSLN